MIKRHCQRKKKTTKLFIAVVGANTFGAQVDQSAAIGQGKINQDEIDSYVFLWQRVALRNEYH